MIRETFCKKLIFTHIFMSLCIKSVNRPTLLCNKTGPIVPCPPPFQKCWIRPWSLPPKNPQEKEKKCGAYPHNRVQLCHLNCLAILTGGGGKRDKTLSRGTAAPLAPPLATPHRRKCTYFFNSRMESGGPAPTPYGGLGVGGRVRPTQECTGTGKSERLQLTPQ